MKYNSGYMYGSTAPKLPRTTEPAKRVIKGNSPVRSQSKTQNIPKSRMIFCILFSVAVSLVILYRFSVITELNYRMGQLNKEYSALREENRMLQVEIAKSINLDRVKELAEKNLNMHKPERYQTVLVSVPRNNFSVVMDQEYIDKTTENASLMKKLMDTIKAVLP